MTHTLATSQSSVVPRSQYEHVRSLLALACIAVIGLSIAVALLASSSSVTRARVTRASVNISAATTDAGARLDHRGLHDPAYLSALAEPGARLDHRGQKTSSTHRRPSRHQPPAR